MKEVRTPPENASYGIRLKKGLWWFRIGYLILGGFSMAGTFVSRERVGALVVWRWASMQP